MNLYLLSQEVNRNYDTYDSMLIVANTEDEAKLYSIKNFDDWGAWVDNPEVINAKIVGITDKYQDAECIISSFNAG